MNIRWKIIIKKWIMNIIKKWILNETIIKKWIMNIHFDNYENK
jgi:hypothetical protein